jgi:hypothetical protein
LGENQFKVLAHVREPTRKKEIGKKRKKQMGFHMKTWIQFLKVCGLGGKRKTLSLGFRMTPLPREVINV